jgi:hypothetical protein
MTRVTIDDALRAKLNGLNEQIELCDESGHELGHFLPAHLYRNLLDAWVHSLFSDEELTRVEQETGGRPLVEIWRSLGRT